ncbi:hypothetical protein BDV28DRAFT_125810 [Aspergillus coremiiformis]|uniref:FAD linked oxidase N-terminal domain-containing protein n=1 Tax=Aspergillus coremiiformis TaxID=138285 RepID=A0A5N6Z4S8_9EURO|nr:hypothetical protein BDV28DRAFT_125810 [Aspergillus coremiiformis]
MALRLLYTLFLCLFPSQVWSLTTSEQAAHKICSHFNGRYPNITFLSSSSQYEAQSTENWSETAWGKPTCIVEPTDTHDLQEMVRTLSYRGVHFAIRSGGHMPSVVRAGCRLV